ncbi:hypothetical protein DID88_009958 [Monilinia fructigena]|uniref:alpha-1,2-Mannosidase n=1 Tax=Monilinia fructigena TaxID=38457 RepID=A0A395IK49_9HELO|nr:hypothetical protein DID88_009958 [Monilinia fructigena]
MPRKPPTQGIYEDSDFEDLHPIAPPGRQDLPVFSAAPTTIHWSKQPEHFPIQYLFKDETTDAKITREKRQNKVKEEFLRSWNGYKKYAWGHDELSPVSSKFRDPFCGWAATLVDGLDTLWIMGLHDEFEEAVKGVEKIDFTTTPRMDIPVFETTIRYLGGLLAAYDVSECRYSTIAGNQLFASQPHRASPRSNLAELGSLSMEFTRLAQLTGDERYYDAVARVTNALSEWQDRNSTQIAGVFPEDVDATGCNLLPGEPGKARIKGWEEGRAKKRDLEEVKADLPGSSTVSSPPPPAANEPPVSKPGLGLAHKYAPDLPTVGGSDDWDCIKQGLEAYSQHGRQVFSMGGGQDSTYEYFPKQHLLLGGLEKVYQKMYMKTIVAIRDHMLFRPMTPDNDDILISGKVARNSNMNEEVLTPEITHLTCFIGGMVGMSAKIFGIEGDLEIAKKLTDGCVWAYGAMPSGIMPEGSEVIACENAEKCTWNQTLYYERLDPSADYRDANLKEYIENKEKLDAEAKEMNLNPTDAAREQNALAKAEAVEKETAADLSPKSKSGETHPAGRQDASASGTTSANTVSPKKDSLETKSDHAGAFKPKVEPASLTKRQSVPAGTMDGPDKESMFKQKSANTEAELESMARGRELEKGTKSQKPLPAESLPDPLRPLSHKEYVESRIRQESLPPGFVSIHARKYILRPEAIESVWYMYRITGDKSWQEKGWKMFEAVINATSTKYGHSLSTMLPLSPHFS